LRKQKGCVDMKLLETFSFWECEMQWVRYFENPGFDGGDVDDVCILVFDALQIGR
jgi:hypothetical protein